MKPLRIIVISCLICSISSCGLVGSALRLPGSLMKSVGRTMGTNALTDDAPEPIKTVDQRESRTSEKEQPALAE